MDDEINEFFGVLFNGKDIKNALENEKIGENSKNDIKLFQNITGKELKEYAGIKGLNWEKDYNKPYKKILDELEKKHHETRASLYNSLNELRRILGQKN